MNRLILFFLILFACATPSSAIALPQQTSVNRQESLGTPIETYELQPGLIVIILRNSEGNPLEAIVQGAVVPHPRSDVSSLEPYPIYLNLTEQQIEKLIDRLVPRAERGKRSETYGQWGICTDVCVFDYSYENVAISLIGRAQWQDSDEAFSPIRSGPSRFVIRWKRN